MSPNVNSTKGEYAPVTDYVAALKGEEFKELNAKQWWNIAKTSMAELIGTAIFVGIGCGSVILFPNSTPDHLQIVISFGFAVTLVITVFGHISGAFINPSLTLVAMVLGKLSLPMFMIYTVAQCIGATLGIAAVKAISPSDCINGSFCVTLPDENIDVASAVLAEALMTFCLGLVLAGVLDPRNSDKQDSVALKFGFAVVALALPGAKYTGCSMNPARSFGPALLAGKWTHHWVYWVGPLSGAACAGILYQVFSWEENRTKHILRVKSESTELA